MRLILGRLPLLVVLLAAISLAIFALSQRLPGDPAFVAAGGGDATPEMIAHARARLGLDRLHVGLSHVHATVALGRGQRRPEAVQAFLFAVAGQVRHPTSLQIGHHGQVANDRA